MTGGDAAPFDLGGPLPTGRVTLEASAGTGKTYVVVGLATRYLAEGHCTVSQLLVVTFARSATRELRERLLAGLIAAHDHLDGVLRGLPPTGGVTGPLRDALVAGDPSEVEARQVRLARAMADIDQATISTIHGFAATMLSLVGEGSPAGRLIEDETELLAEIAGDLWLRVAGENPDDAGSLPYFGYSGFELATKGVRRLPSEVRPPPSLSGYETAAAWVAVQAREEYDRRKQQMLVHTHDDLLHRLASALENDETAVRLRQRFAVALVDEFQDTDPVQWAIFDRLFPPPPTLRLVGSQQQPGNTLVLVGDPKQAIYSFRGADVNAYVQARGDAAAFTLPTNHRTDSALVDAVLALFDGQPLGHGIDVPGVGAVNQRSRLSGLDDAPVHLRVVADDAPVRRTHTGMSVSSVREFVSRDVARQAATLLASGVSILDATDVEDPVEDDGDRTNPDARPLVPSDIAVLVRTRRQAGMVQRHLTAAGIPSILSGVGNVMQTRAARDWGHLLRAIAQPSRGSTARLAAMTDLIGWTPSSIIGATPEDWDRLHVNLHDWGEVLEEDGVAAALRHVEAETALSVRLVREPDGARRLTDLRHVAELLHGVATAELVGVAGLIDWLEAGLAGEGENSSPMPPKHLASRLERQSGAVRIMTVHGAKGLEFEVVFAPFLWDRVGRSPVAVDVYDPRQGKRILFAGGRKNDPDRQHYHDLHSQQQAEEERRLAYVAATRAKHHLRLWFAPANGVADSPIGSLLSDAGRVSTSQQAMAAVDRLIARQPGSLRQSVIDGEAAMPPVDSALGARAAIDLATFDRDIDVVWRRTSYSRIAGQASEGSDDAATEVDASGKGLSGPVEQTEEPVDAPTSVPVPQPASPTPMASDQPSTSVAPGMAVVVPLNDLRGGADIGTAIHAVLEHLDFVDAPIGGQGLDARLADEVGRQSARHAVDLGEDEVLDSVHAGLAASLRTPLGPTTGPLGAVSLTDVTRGMRLDEMAFELPVRSHHGVGADASVLVAEIADLMASTLPDDDPLAEYPALLRSHLAPVRIRGYLAGFIDLVARIPGTQRYLVADYKTNKLGPPGTDELLVGHYTAPEMARAMVHHHYPLQALLYQVALHRYLRWRLPDYDPKTNLGGSAYLFLRGMVGPDTPETDGMRCGVFLWQPPAELIAGVDSLFAAADGGGTA